ncbi:MAG TPA: response regulator [Dongiaceae bacterium]|nr:response regulator [Dongiaceae bacterium]
MSIKVLVADDSVTIRKVIGIIFGGDEYSLTIVDNGKAAVDKAREINPDILLIDALMPGMTGYEVTELVRATPSLAAKPVLILTGSFEPFDEEKAKNSGADDFIAKPFESQQIITKVKELLELGRSRAVQASQPHPAAEAVREQGPEVSASIFDIPTPDIVKQPEVQQPAAPADIWGAFTPAVEPPSVTGEASPGAVQPAATFEPDVFAIVSEESDAGLVQTTEVSDTSPHHTGTQWVPVEESTFEFEEEIVATPPRAALDGQTAPNLEASFGDITFENDEAAPADAEFSAISEPDFTAPAPAFSGFAASAPAFEEPPALEPIPDVEIAVPAATPPAAALTEEQLRAAITSASKEVIERIVWEVVPDLAEAMIREAIRKIKEGA